MILYSFLIFNEDTSLRYINKVTVVSITSLSRNTQSRVMLVSSVTRCLVEAWFPF